MAREIPDLPPRPSRKVDGRRRGRPWDEWANGAVWQLERGVDFDGLTVSIASAAYSAARRRGMSAHVRVVDDDTVVIQFTPGMRPAKSKRRRHRRIP